MTERTIDLDPGLRGWRSRKIHVRAYRWYATVSLDRDGYLSATDSSDRDDRLPAAYTEAVDRAREACMDRIRYDGCPGEFAWGSGPTWIPLFVPFPHVDAAVEALRTAELDHDYSGLHTLAERLALPVDGWLAPGQRELVRGVDFASPPAVFLRFLRRKAKEQGVRLNGRATAGSVWVRPTLSPVEKQEREAHPERYPGWVDRWTGYAEPDGAPARPRWAAGSTASVTARCPSGSVRSGARAAATAPVAWICTPAGRTTTGTPRTTCNGRSVSPYPGTSRGGAGWPS